MGRKMRITWIDTVRGIAILCVIAGHVVSNYPEYLFVHRLIYSFHMPLFFVASGYLVKRADYIDLHYILKRGKKLIGAYIWFSLIFYLRVLLTGTNLMNSAESVINTILMNYKSPFSIHWFFVALLLGDILFGFLLRFIKTDKLIIGCSVALYLGAVLCSEKLHLVLPLHFEASMLAVVFLAAGYYLNKYDIIQKLSNIKFSGCLFCTIWLAVNFIAFYCFKIGPEAFYCAGIKAPIFFLETGLFGSIFIILIAFRFLTKYKVLNRLGQKSLYYYVWHYTALALYTKVCPIRSNAFFDFIIALIVSFILVNSYLRITGIAKQFIKDYSGRAKLTFKCLGFATKFSRKR